MTKRLVFAALVCMVLIFFCSGCPQSNSLLLEKAPPVVPASPNVLINVTVSEATISISWDAVDGANGYDVYLGTSNNAAAATKKNVSTVVDTDYEITGLNITTKYFIWLKATNSKGDSDFSLVLEVTTRKDPKKFNAIQFYALGGQADICFWANHVKSTKNLDIYLRENQTMSNEDVQYLAENFEKQYDGLIDTYGTHTDVDDNGKIIILLYDINASISPSSGYIAGYFWQGDLLKNYSTGNKAEILYVESQVSDDIENIFGTVIHEFQHLINFKMTSVEKGAPSDLWLNEALSESSEILVSGGMPGNRMDIYNNSNYPYHYSIASGNYFYHWGGDYVLADYSTASLFMYWLYLNGGGEAILKNIAQSSVANRGDYSSILEAVGKTNYRNPLSSLKTWEAVLFAWLEANENYATGVLDGYPNGKYTANRGKTGELQLSSKIYSGGSASVNLFPGDAVLSAKETTGNESNTDIVRSTFISAAPPLDTVNITLNKNTTVNDSFISVQVPAASVHNTARMIKVPLLIDDEYRIIHLPQRPLTGEVYK